MVLAYLLTINSGNNTRIPASIILLYVFFVVTLRGSVGTDTSTYELMVGNIDESLIWSGVEVGFRGVSIVFSSFINSPAVIVRCFSILILFFVGVYLYRSNKNERYILLSYIMPAFVYQYSMNTLRLGLASVFIMLALQHIRRGKAVHGTFLSLVSVAFHYSSIFSLAYILMCQVKWIKSLNFVFLFLFVGAGVLLFTVNQEYFLHKIDAYSLSFAPSFLSGVSKIIVLTVFFASVCLSTMESVEKLKFVFLGFILMIGFWGVSFLSYAGLRLLDLLSFAVPMTILVIFNRKGREFDFSIRIGMVIAGLLSAIFVFRNYVSEIGQGSSPFLPYNLGSFINEL